MILKILITITRALNNEKQKRHFSQQKQVNMHTLYSFSNKYTCIQQQTAYTMAIKLTMLHCTLSSSSSFIITPMAAHI